MTLRKPQKLDAPSIAALSIEVWIGTYLKRGVGRLFADYVLNEFTSQKIETLISDPAQFMIVSENEEGIDGYIRVSAGSPAPVSGCSDIEISTLYVQPRHHGKGIGTRLFKAALQFVREMGVHSVWLTTNAENSPAIAFYIRQGFEQVGETHFRIEKEAYLNNVYCYRFQ